MKRLVSEEMFVLSQFLWETAGCLCALCDQPHDLFLSALSCLSQFVTKAVCLLWVEGIKTHPQPTPPTYPQRRAQSRLVWSPPKAIVLKLSVSSSWILTLLLTLMWRKLLTFREASCYHLFQRRSERWNIKKNKSKQWYGPQLSRVNSKWECGESWSGLEYTGPNPKLA